MIGRSNVSGGGSIEVFMGEATLTGWDSRGNSDHIYKSVDVDLPFIPTKIICYAEYTGTEIYNYKQSKGSYFQNRNYFFLATNENYTTFGSSLNECLIKVSYVSDKSIQFDIYPYYDDCIFWGKGSFTFKFIAIKE